MIMFSWLFLHGRFSDKIFVCFSHLPHRVSG
jgi:hypothetical protein